MQNSKLQKLLISLNPDEFKRFGRFIRSPYYGYNPNILALYEYLKKYYPTFDSPKLEREKVFNKLFPNEGFSWNKLKKLMSTLTQLAEEYLVTLELEHESFQKKKWLTKALGRRQVYDLFNRETDQLLDRLEKQPFRDMTFYQEKIDLISARYFHPQFNRYDKKDWSMESISDNLDSYFALSKMRFGTEIQVRKRILNRPIEMRFWDSLIEEKERDFLQDNPTFQLYFTLNQLLREQTENRFYELENLLFENIQLLQRVDQQVLFFHGLNFIVRMVNRGEDSFSSKAFKWYKLGLKEELLIEEGLMSETTFGNIIGFGCREKEFEWTYDFIHSKKSYLKEEVREDAYTFNMSLWYFYQNEFTEVQSFLLSHNFSITYQPKVRLTEIRAIFEQFLKNDSYFELLIAKIQSFEGFIKRNTVFSKDSLESYLNCIRIIEKITNKILKMDEKEEILNWLEKMTRSRKVITKNWLFEKVQNLK